MITSPKWCLGAMVFAVLAGADCASSSATPDDTTDGGTNADVNSTGSSAPSRGSNDAGGSLSTPATQDAAGSLPTPTSRDAGGVAPSGGFDAAGTPPVAPGDASTDVSVFSSPITIVTTSIPAGVVGTPYSASFVATSTAGAITRWQTVDANGNSLAYPVPAPGLRWGGLLTITGTPTTAGTTTFVFKVTDSANNSVTTGPYPLVITDGSPASAPDAGSGGHSEDAGTGGRSSDAGSSHASDAHGSSSAALVHVGGWVSNDSTVTAQEMMESFGATAADSPWMVFGWGTGWAQRESAEVSLAATLGAWPGPKVLAHLMVDDTASDPWTDVTGGTHDAALTAIAQACGTNGVEFIRMAWEFDNSGGASPGGLPAFGTYTAAEFISAWQHTVTVMRAANANLKFIYNPNSIRGDAATLVNYYAGDDYVDLVALDFYDENTGWNGIETTPITAPALLAFAIAHGKSIMIPEWGMIPTSAGSYGSGDDPTFVTDTINWAESAADQGVPVWLLVWGGSYPTLAESGWSITAFPNSAAALKTAVTAGIAAGKIAG
jgi:hypothetical protein